MGYRKKVISTLLNKICIIDVISHYLDCQKRAPKNDREYVALCPFHREKTPSFTITTYKQFYHCFGCGAHGNAIHFVMEYEGIDFLKAVKKVAEITNFSLPSGPRPSNKKISDRKKYHKKKDGALKKENRFRKLIRKYY